MGELTRESTRRYPLALCDDDRCPWKHAGVTPEHTRAAAERHVIETAHSVTLYEHNKRVGHVEPMAQVRYV